MTQKHPILHMASFSRSGETVLLRSLQAHHRIHVVHQVRDPETPENLNLFKTLMCHEPLDISTSHPAVRAANVPDAAVLVVKNAVWTHQWDFRGFVLVRNPFSVVNSFKISNESLRKTPKRRKQLKRWTCRIDRALLPAMNKFNATSYVSMLYNRKMHDLAYNGLPIVRYEDFVESPETTLRGLLGRLDLSWDDAVLKSHTNYKPGDFGHGQICLWEPIHSRSSDSWRKVHRTTRSGIYGITYPTMHAYGYHYDGENLSRSRNNASLV
jgi:hypothetical protein